MISQGRDEEAKLIVEKFAKSNKTVLEKDDWQLVVKTESLKVESCFVFKWKFITIVVNCSSVMSFKIVRNYLSLIFYKTLFKIFVLKETNVNKIVLA